MAALLFAGADAVLSHRTAAVVWNLLPGSATAVHLITAAQHGRKDPRLVPHRMQLHADEVMVVNGLRVTTPARTIVDLAAHLAPPALREAVERAQDVRRFHPTDIGACLQRVPRRRGIRGLTHLLELLQPDEDRARSHLERLFPPSYAGPGLRARP